MELNSNSISAKLYRWFYNRHAYEMPQSLCPYFWQLLLMYVLIVPYVLIALPYLFFNKGKNQSISTGIFGPIIIYVLMYIIFSMITLIFGLFVHKLPNTFFWVTTINIGVNTWLIVSVYFVVRLIFSIIDGNGKTLKEEKPNLLVEFVKAKYNKYCPKITWK